MAARGDRSLRDVASTTMGSRHSAKGKDEKEGNEEESEDEREEEREEVVAVPWVVWLLRCTPWLRQLVRGFQKKKNMKTVDVRILHTPLS